MAISETRPHWAGQGPRTGQDEVFTWIGNHGHELEPVIHHIRDRHKLANEPEKPKQLCPHKLRRGDYAKLKSQARLRRVNGSGFRIWRQVFCQLCGAELVLDSLAAAKAAIEAAKQPEDVISPAQFIDSGDAQYEEGEEDDGSWARKADPGPTVRSTASRMMDSADAVPWADLSREFYRKLTREVASSPCLDRGYTLPFVARDIKYRRPTLTQVFDGGAFPTPLEYDLRTGQRKERMAMREGSRSVWIWGTRKDKHPYWLTVTDWLSTSAARSKCREKVQIPETLRAWAVICSCCPAPPLAPIDHGACMGIAIKSELTKRKGCAYAISHGHSTIDSVPHQVPLTKRLGLSQGFDIIDGEREGYSITLKAVLTGKKEKDGPWKKLPPHILTNVPGCTEYQEFFLHTWTPYHLRVEYHIWAESPHPLDNPKNWNWLNPERLEADGMKLTGHQWLQLLYPAKSWEAVQRRQQPKYKEIKPQDVPGSELHICHSRYTCYCQRAKDWRAARWMGRKWSRLFLESFNFIVHPQDELDPRFWVAPEIEIRRFRACGDEICALRLTTRSVDRILAPSVDGILPGAFYNDCGSIVPARWRNKAEFLRYSELLLHYGGPRPRWMGMNYVGAHCDYGRWNDVGRQIIRVTERKKKYAFGMSTVRYVSYKWVVKEFSIEEIAAITGLSLRTVHYRLAEAGLRKKSERIPSSNCPEIVRLRCPEPVLKDELGQELTTEGD